jgi:hypothetical protein
VASISGDGGLPGGMLGFGGCASSGTAAGGGASRASGFREEAMTCRDSCGRALDFGPDLSPGSEREGGREGMDLWRGQCLDEDATHGGVGPSCSTRLQLVPDVIHVFV